MPYLWLALGHNYMYPVPQICTDECALLCIILVIYGVTVTFSATRWSAQVQSRCRADAASDLSAHVNAEPYQAAG